ncbi:MAG: NAD-binding protein [Syntrophaceae bacterium]|nr:NAD-binding protein [Syntrophaceae bacterium]
MKFLPAVVSSFVESKTIKANIRLLVKYLLVIIALITTYSILFHYIMAMEGQEHSWITGFYWTMVVMSTLGFGDITFTSDLGRTFSIVVLLSGVILLLVLLPFIFIKFFFAPWMEAQARSRAPRELPSDTRNHIIITNFDPVTAALIEKLKSYKKDYIVIIEDLSKALDLYDKGIKVALGNIDDPQTYTKMRAQNAALVVASNSDQVNTNITLTLREDFEHIPIITTAESPHSVDILQLAGSSLVLQLYDIMGSSLAAWTVAGECKSNIINRYKEFVIAQSPAMGTPLVGKTLAQSKLRETFGLTVIGIWERGKFIIPEPDYIIERTSVLVLAGLEASLAQYDEVYSFYHICKIAGDPVIIVGGGRVGLAVAARFQQQEIPYLIIEKNRRKSESGSHFVFGDAADIHTLERAWFEKAPAAIITSHDDATNIYLTKYLRSLRPDMQILSRASEDRNVSTLHRAGADFVMSYASLGANTIFNFLINEETMLLAEGLNIFHLPTPKSLLGKTLMDSGIRKKTGCTVIAIVKEGNTYINPEPAIKLGKEEELILIGTYEAERSFLAEFSA